MLRFVTSNRHKFEEFSAVASRFGLRIELVSKDRPEIQSDDLEQIAVSSARSCAPRLGKGFFVEDAGLFVNALRGFPGPYSSYAYSTIGYEGVLDLLREKEDRSAFFLSVICHYDGRYRTFTGKVEGRISPSARGSSGFGFDPIFIPDGETHTFAEMGPRKNEISHRARSAEIFFRTLINGR